MPTIKYPKNPNIDTAFVEQDDGTKNRALMIAPQDISTLELPNNPNSTKGYITVDGKKQRVILTADITGGGGGGSGLPDQTGHSGEFLTTDGTDASWAAVNALPSQTGNAGKFLTTDGTDASWSDKPLVNTATGQNTFNLGRSEGNTVSSGTAVGINSYLRGNSSVAVGMNAVANNKSVAIGSGSGNYSAQGAVSIGAIASAGDTGAISIGAVAKATANYAIQIGCGNIYTGAENSDANTFKVANANGNYELMSADGTIPEARLADTTNAQQGDVLTLDANGDAVWQAGGSGGGLPSQTGNAGKFLTTDGTDASWGDALVNRAAGGGIAIGSNAQSTSGVSIGNYARATSGVLIGSSTEVQSNTNIIIGNVNAVFPKNVVFINTGGTSSVPTGAAQGDFWFRTVAPGAGYATSYLVMDGRGFIPTARLTKVNTTITIAVADWNGGTTVTKTVTGMTATGVVLVSPDPTDQSAYTSAGIICTAQAADSLTFTCSTTPSADIDVNVVML